MNPQTLYLHIGTAKTGTTYIQRLFYENRDVFHKLGVSYPYLLPTQNHRWANANFLFDSTNETQLFKIFQRLGSKILVSEEKLFHNIALLNHPLFQKFKIKIILYLRKPAELIASWATEHTRPYNVTTAPGRDTTIMSITEGIEVLSKRYETDAKNFLLYA